VQSTNVQSAVLRLHVVRPSVCPSIRTKAHKNFGEKGVWVYPETAQIYWVPPIISGTGESMNFKFGWNIHRVSEQKLIKNFGKKGAWAHPGTEERIKLRTSHFVRIFIASVGRKAP